MKEKDRKTFNKKVGIAIIMVFLFVGGFIGGRLYQSNEASIKSVFSGNSSADMTLFWQVWDLMKGKYVDSSKSTDQNMVYGAIKGMVNSYDDAATVFLTPEETKAFNDASEGKYFEGIGAELGYEDGQIIVVTPIEGSPAKAAGIKAGDYILAIDGTKVDSTMSVYDAVAKIRGAAGTTVKLTILHKGDSKTVDITITRAAITVPSMSVSYVGTNKDIALFTVSRFTDSSYTEWTQNWDKNVDAIVASGAKKVILDLRGNPGGYFDAAIYAADDFVDAGKVLSEQKDSSGNIQKFNSTKGGKLTNVQVVVLVNSGTASAAEILTGALQQAGRATVIGDKTYGKGTAQSVIDLSDGSSLHVTILKWLLPDGNWLNRDNPITPDTQVSISDADFLAGKDTQLNAAISQLSK